MNIRKSWVLSIGLLANVIFPACSGERKEVAESVRERPAPPPPGPARLVLVEKPVQLQATFEPWTKRLDFEFELPRPPRRARLVMRYSGVPGALSEDYKLGRYRDKLELNNTFLMDLNTYSESESQVVEYTKWIPVGMLKRHNKLTFIAGDDGAREGSPRYDEFELRSAVLEFDW